jgi:hypothetical protein
VTIGSTKLFHYGSFLISLCDSPNLGKLLQESIRRSLFKPPPNPQFPLIEQIYTT